MAEALSAQVKEAVSAKMYERRLTRHVSGDCFRHFGEDLRPRAETASNTIASTASDALAGISSEPKQRIKQVFLDTKPKRDDPLTPTFNE